MSLFRCPSLFFPVLPLSSSSCSPPPLRGRVSRVRIATHGFEFFLRYRGLRYHHDAAGWLSPRSFIRDVDMVCTSTLVGDDALSLRSLHRRVSRKWFTRSWSQLFGLLVSLLEIRTFPLRRIKRGRPLDRDCRFPRTFREDDVRSSVRC